MSLINDFFNARVVTVVRSCATCPAISCPKSESYDPAMCSVMGIPVNPCHLPEPENFLDWIFPLPEELADDTDLDDLETDEEGDYQI